jgi:RNA polymerase sigma-70 factor, ECF subfamily
VVKTGEGAPGVPNDGQALAGRSDAELVRLLLDGDESALAALYDRFAATIYRAALLRLGDRQLAEEVLQDTYLALWNRAELFDPRQGSLIAWLATIARNRATDRLRSLGRRPSALPLSGVLESADPERQAADAMLHRAQPVAGVTAEVNPEHVMDDAWLRGEVERALAEIPAQERQVIHLAYYEELTQTEIAARLDWPLGTVKTRTRRGLRHLRQTLSRALGPELGARFATEDETDGSS